MANEIRTPAFCTQCRSRCGCVAVVRDGRLAAIEPTPDHPTGEKLCPKGRAAPELVYHKDRLTVPLRRTAPKGAADPMWQPIEWDVALDEIARRMQTIKTQHGPEQVAFSVTTPSGTHISDSIDWIERLHPCIRQPQHHLRHRDLQLARLQAMENRQLSAAIAAIKEIGVLTGLRIERRERGGPGEFDGVSTEQIITELRELGVEIKLH